ncbi:hypothetical protein ZOSMA_632G00010 [Zostera marina]|uniref:Uncharacterized protein n=1 Tax=Zostera marina TaxID=29655 RepID=A0A0K9NVE3_ZOSMR|nr:hypothetical protein ZOSMA_632G00010 [Zostera marina]
MMNEGQAPSIFVQNENINVPLALGKGVDIINHSARSKKKNKGGLNKDRKALAHLSGVPKPLAFQNTFIKNTKETVNKKQQQQQISKKDTLLSEADIKNCQEWAKEGIESCPFTFNDEHRLQKNAFDLRVKNEVDMVVGSMKIWSDTCFNDVFDLPRSQSEAPKDIDDTLELILEPEITSGWSKEYFSDNDENIDALFFNTDDDYLFNSDDDDHFVVMASPTSTHI